MTDSLPDYGEDSDIQTMAEDFLVRHVVPEALVNQKDEIVKSVEQIVKDEKYGRFPYHQNRNKH